MYHDVPSKCQFLMDCHSVPVNIQAFVKWRLYFQNYPMIWICYIPYQKNDQKNHPSFRPQSCQLTFDVATPYRFAFSCGQSIHNKNHQTSQASKKKPMAIMSWGVILHPLLKQLVPLFQRIQFFQGSLCSFSEASLTPIMRRIFAGSCRSSIKAMKAARSSARLILNCLAWILHYRYCMVLYRMLSHCMIYILIIFERLSHLSIRWWVIIFVWPELS